MNRRVVVLAQDVDLRIGQRDNLVRDLLRDLEVAACEQLEAQTVPGSLRQIEKLLGIVSELVAGRRRQRLERDGGPVIAASELVGARKMIERAPPLALRPPEEAECAMSLVMLRLELGGAAEGLDRFLRLAQCLQRDGAVVVSRDIAGVCPERRVETAHGLAVTPLGRNGDAEVVGDRGITWHDRQRRPIGVLSLCDPSALKMVHGVGEKRAEFGGWLLRHGLLPRPCLASLLFSRPYKKWRKF